MASSSQINIYIICIMYNSLNTFFALRFEPGNDNHHFCKPTSVAVMESGDFFVSDGYCNSQIIKYSAAGQRITHWGMRTFQGSFLSLLYYNMYQFYKFYN